ncbi:MAG: sulfatase-like hydrolase/transferase [Lentisphaerales bacterium]|nr:sulfatase-like hydrolase/transferase [Lentisphaerales bacterium]
MNYRLLLIFLCLVSLYVQAQTSKNVLVIVADDHALKVTGAYGNQRVRTPNLDQLSKEGITFTQTYCNSPICSASRQSMLTGKYPHATGVNLLFTPFRDSDNETIAEYLSDRGYETALIGKSHFNNWNWGSLYKNGLPKHGFKTIIDTKDYRKFLKSKKSLALPKGMEFYDKVKAKEAGTQAEWMNARVLPHPVRDADSKGTFLANQAVSFMKGNKQKPFFLWLAFYEPHHPFYFPTEYAGKYKAEDMVLPPVSSEDDRWVPEKYRELTDAERKGIIASYYSSTEYLDKNIGVVLKALKEKGLEKDTLVLYLSDNGYLLNEHKRFEKHTMWQEAVHQPMIIKNGKRAGEKVESLIEYIDVAPTITDLIGQGIMPEAQGRSFKAVVEGKKDTHKEYAFAEYLEDNLAMVTTKRWKYVFTTGSRDLGINYKTGFGLAGLTHRLYDFKNDPNEHRDVSRNSENLSTLKLLQSKMFERFMETHPDAKNCPDELTLEGKLVWFCEPRDVGTDQNPLDKPVRVFQNK